MSDRVEDITYFNCEIERMQIQITKNNLNLENIFNTNKILYKKKHASHTSLVFFMRFYKYIVRYPGTVSFCTFSPNFRICQDI